MSKPTSYSSTYLSTLENECSSTVTLGLSSQTHFSSLQKQLFHDRLLRFSQTLFTTVEGHCDTTIACEMETPNENLIQQIKDIKENIQSLTSDVQQKRQLVPKKVEDQLRMQLSTPVEVPVIEEEEVLDGIQDEFVQRLHHSYTQMSMSMEQLSEKMPATVEQLERVLQTMKSTLDQPPCKLDTILDATQTNSSSNNTML